MTEWKNPCEWNPETNMAALDFEVHGEAELSVGVGYNWHLCRSCAALPRFKNYRVVKELRRL